MNLGVAQCNLASALLQYNRWKTMKVDVLLLEGVKKLRIAKKIYEDRNHLKGKAFCTQMLGL